MVFLGVITLGAAVAKNNESAPAPFSIGQYPKIRVLTAAADCSAELKVETAAAAGASVLVTTAAAGYLLPANTAIDIPMFPTGQTVSSTVTTRSILCAISTAGTTLRVWGLYA